jgi:hypothetical protein
MEAIKPQVKSRTLPVFQNIRGLALTLAADEALLDGARVVSEGEIETRSSREHTYFGSTFVTINLKRGDLDLGPAEGEPSIVLDAARTSLLFRTRLLRLARVEAERRCFPYLMRGMSTHTEFKFADNILLVDINVECPLAIPVAEERES